MRNLHQQKEKKRKEETFQSFAFYVQVGASEIAIVRSEAAICFKPFQLFFFPVFTTPEC